MLIDQCKWAAALLCGVALLGAGLAWGMRQSPGEGPLAAAPPDERRAPPPLARPLASAAGLRAGDEKKGPPAERGPERADWVFPRVDAEHPIYVCNIGVVMGVRAEKRRVLARMQRTRLSAPFAIAPNARMSFSAPGGMRRTFTQKLGLGDIRKGMVIDDIERSEDGRTFTSFTCSWPYLNGKVKAVNRKKRALTIEKESMIGDQDVGSLRGKRTFPVAREALVVVDGPNARAFLLDLDDVPVGCAVGLTLQIDQSVRLVTLYPTDHLRGVLRSTAPAKRTVLVALQGGGSAFDLGLEVKKGAAIRLEGKSVSLGDLKKGMPVLLRLSADRRTVVGLWAMRPPR
jgi:hypothetical protein